MRALEKARSFAAARQGSSRAPGLFMPPYGGSAYFGRSYRLRQVIAYKYWLYIGLQPWVREIAYGEPINLGRLHTRKKDEKKRMRRTKAIGGPREHEEFDPLEEGDPMLRVFRRPNMFDTADEFWAYHVLFYFMTGESHWWVRRNGFGVPKEMWVIPTHWMQLQMGSDGMPSHYLVQSPWGVIEHIPFDEVTSFLAPSLLNRWEGTGVTQACPEWIDVYESMVRVWLATFKNGANPTYHIALGDRYGDPDDAMLARHYAKIFGRFQGEDKAGQPIITGGDIEIKQLGLTQDEIQFAQSEEKIRDNVLAALNVSKTVIGIEPSSDLSSYAPLRGFCRLAANPEKRRIGRRITEMVIKPTPGYEEGVAFFDESTLEDPEQVRRDRESNLEHGVTTIEEERAKMGLESYPHGGRNPMVQGVEMPWVTGNMDDALQTAYLTATTEHPSKEGAQPPAAPAAPASPASPTNGEAATELAFKRAMATDGGATGGYMLPVNGNGKKPPTPKEEEPEVVEEDERTKAMNELKVERKALVDALAHASQKASPNVTVNPAIYLPPPPAIENNITVQPAAVPQTIVKNEVPKADAPVIHVNVPTAAAPTVNVNVPAATPPDVNVTLPEMKPVIVHPKVVLPEMKPQIIVPEQKPAPRKVATAPDGRQWVIEEER